MKKIKEKIIVIILALSFITSSGMLLAPRPVYASVPTTDFTLIGKTVADWATQVARWFKEDSMKALRDVVAKRIIDYIVDQTIVWIQGGGQPKFITDWSAFLKDAGNIAFDQVMKEVGLARLCYPFSPYLQITLLPVQRFQQQLDCTLDKVVNNIDNFYQDFKNGGWIAYNEAWQPQNNYYGSLMKIHDELLIRSSEQTQAAQNEGISGLGFLSTKKCIELDQFEYTSCLTAGGSQASCEQSSCTNWQTTTPGSTVGQAVASAITSDVTWAANIQSWVSALVNAVINRLTKQGIGAIQTTISGGGGSTSGGSYYPPEYQSLVDSSSQSQNQQEINQIKQFTDEWQYLIGTESDTIATDRQLAAVLSQLQAQSGCQLAFPGVDAQSVQNEINSLQSDIDSLNAQITEANNLITQINSAVTWTEINNAQQTYSTFIDKYAYELAIIIEGSDRATTNQQLINRENQLSQTQTNLASCTGGGAAPGGESGGGFGGGP